MLKCGVKTKKLTAVDKSHLIKLARTAIEDACKTALGAFIWEPVDSITMAKIEQLLTSVVGHYLAQSKFKPAFKVVNTTTEEEAKEGRITAVVELDWGDGGTTHLTEQHKILQDVFAETLAKYGFKVAGKA
jgi:hypothetical protein